MALYRRKNIKSPFVHFTEPPLANFSEEEYNQFLEISGGMSKPEDAPEYNPSGNTGSSSNSIGLIDSIANGITSVLNSTTGLLGSIFGRNTQVVDTNQKSSMNTTTLLIGAVLVVVLIVFLMKKQ